VDSLPVLRLSFKMSTSRHGDKRGKFFWLSVSFIYQSLLDTSVLDYVSLLHFVLALLAFACWCGSMVC
jgi:hypothetical protein